MVDTPLESYRAMNVVIATGGLPVPAIGATDFAMQIAQQFEIDVVATRPALVPLAFTSANFFCY
jgi:predicted flavoprotein YhiN